MIEIHACVIKERMPLVLAALRAHEGAPSQVQASHKSEKRHIINS